MRKVLVTIELHRQHRAARTHKYHSHPERWLVSKPPTRVADLPMRVFRLLVPDAALMACLRQRRHKGARPGVRMLAVSPAARQRAVLLVSPPRPGNHYLVAPTAHHPSYVLAAQPALAFHMWQVACTPLPQL
jgi:hypothetical protein